MGEFPSDEVGHGDEVVDAAITTGAGTCLLKCSIHCFDTAVVFAGFEAVEYARKVLGKGPAEALEGFHSRQRLAQLSQRFNRGLAWSCVLAVA
jgi:hypothetical protein